MSGMVKMAVFTLFSHSEETRLRLSSPRFNILRWIAVMLCHVCNSLASCLSISCTRYLPVLHTYQACSAAEAFIPCLHCLLVRRFIACYSLYAVATFCHMSISCHCLPCGMFVAAWQCLSHMWCRSIFPGLLDQCVWSQFDLSALPSSLV